VLLLHTAAKIRQKNIANPQLDGGSQIYGDEKKPAATRKIKLCIIYHAKILRHGIRPAKTSRITG
jgi:hypothetical protein